MTQLRPPAPPIPFNKERCGRWLRMLLSAFYGDEEAVVADLLYQRGALLRDTVIAHTLGLPDRQVRQALERRLVPDCLVERKTEALGTRVQSFYRISPLALQATASRLQALEDSLASETPEEYNCPKCHRCYDSLQAASLAASRKAPVGGGDCGDDASFAFLCEECNVELTAVSENPLAQHDRLRRFRAQCRDLLLLTRELREMPIPQFAREEKEKSAHRATFVTGSAPPAEPSAFAAAAAAKAAENPQPPAPSEIASGAARQMSGANPLSVSWWAPEASEWFHKEVLCTPPPPPKQALELISDEAEEDMVQVLKKAIENAQGRLTESQQEHMNDPRRWSSCPDIGESKTARLVVMVAGEPHPLQRCVDEEDLQDRMTDEEFQRFVDLGRETRRLAAHHGRAW